MNLPAGVRRGVEQGPKHVKLDIAQISRTESLQIRAGMSGEVVAEYAQAMRDGDEFPAVIVFHDGQKYWLADGYHRIAAADMAGVLTFKCEVKLGGLRAAIEYALGANSKVGLRRSNDDKRRAVKIMLLDTEWRLCSNREIARQCVVSDALVASVKEDLQRKATPVEVLPPLVTRNAPRPAVAPRKSFAAKRAIDVGPKPVKLTIYSTDGSMRDEIMEIVGVTPDWIRLKQIDTDPDTLPFSIGD